jgi:Zn-ribbon protein, possibly nucleic acid-binding
MLDPQIEKLLIVQDRDIALQKLKQELARIPREREQLEANIERETANIELARQALQAKEVERKDLDNDVKSKENALVRFKTQQMEVKKNDEYKALTHQIEQTEAHISDLEEKEIGLMLEIDELKEAFAKDKAEIDARIEAERALIQQLGEKEKNLSAAITAAEAELSTARGPVDELFLGHYDRVSKMVKRAPYVVSIEGHKCNGCHLRVSNEVSKVASDHGDPHFCDQCARIVYA